MKDLETEREEFRKKQLVAELKSDFARRREERRALECGWELAMNFLSGNQYCDVTPSGAIEEEQKLYYWQNKRVYNHIAPTVETRCAKLARMRPTVRVKAFSDEDADLKTAQLSSDILSDVFEKLDFSALVGKATVWAETCGTAFYAVTWDNGAGNLLATTEDGKRIHEGEVSVCVLSPFELYPDSLAIERLEDQPSLIRARAVDVDEIEEAYGVSLAGREISSFAIVPYAETAHAYTAFSGGKCVKRNAELLIERYRRPSPAFPNGKLEIAAGDVLLYEGELPFRNGEYQKRVYPFVKQACLDVSGAFFGTGIVDRLIPVQRAYNAVRNRKQEFLNRITMGVLTVEDGSVDTDALVEEGLSPGRVIVYRQGSEPPKLMDCGALPAAFEEEETRLLEEFVNISGTSEIARDSVNPTNVTSATGLQLLIDQDDARLAVTSGNIENAMKGVSRFILRLYKQFAGEKRLYRMTGEGKEVKLAYFAASDLSADDVLFEAADGMTPERRQSLLFELMEKGLFENEDGKTDVYTKNRILDALGFGDYTTATELSALHLKRAQEENLALRERELPVRVYDDNALHLAEHTRYLLSEEGKLLEDEALAHFERHYAAHVARQKEKEYGREHREDARG